MIFTGVNDLSHKNPGIIAYSSICQPGGIIVLSYCDEGEPMDDAPFAWDRTMADSVPNSKAAVLVNLADTAEALGYGLEFADVPKSKIYPAACVVAFRFLMKISEAPGHDEQIKQIVDDVRESLSRNPAIVRRDGLYVFRPYGDKRDGVSAEIFTTTTAGARRDGDRIRADRRRAAQLDRLIGLGDVHPAVQRQVGNRIPYERRAHEVLNRDDFVRQIRAEYLDQNWGQGNVVLNFALD